MTKMTMTIKMKIVDQLAEPDRQTQLQTKTQVRNDRQTEDLWIDRMMHDQTDRQIDSYVTFMPCAGILLRWFHMVSRSLTGLNKPALSFCTYVT